MNEELKIIVDFYKDLQRLGPGCDEQTKKALGFIDFATKNPTIADIGCGTGAQTEVLAKETQGEIVAVDFLDEFLKSLQRRFDKANLNVKTICTSMSELPFREQEFDLIWSEGAIYNIGFDYGTRYWNRFLKMNGFLVVTEISWLTDQRPVVLEDYWKNAYSGIDTVANKISQLQNNGYELITHFTLPASCWTDHYYKPIQEKFDCFLLQHPDSEPARKFVEEGIAEIEFYKKYHEFYGYEFYIAKKTVAVV